MVLLLVFMQLTRDLFAIAKFLFNQDVRTTEYGYSWKADILFTGLTGSRSKVFLILIRDGK